MKQRIIRCNNSNCAWNSRINKEPNDGEQCLFTGELTLEIQTPVDGDIRDTMICESYRAPLSKEEHNAL